MSGSTLEGNAKIGRTADEILDALVEIARGVFTPTQIHAWEAKAREDAEANRYAPPRPSDLLLGEQVYMQAFNRRRYKIAKAKRDA